LAFRSQSFGLTMPANSSQRRAAKHETLTEKCRAATFIGSARIRLDNLGFRLKPQQHRIEPNDSNVKRLKGNFYLGCYRLNPLNRIKARISKAQLEQAIAASPDVSSVEDLKTRSDGQLPELVFPLTERVDCLYGEDRIEAAKAVFWGEDRWWSIDLYLKGGTNHPSPNIRRADTSYR
jgi:Protein of unknown function (DUF3723)